MGELPLNVIRGLGRVVSLPSKMPIENDFGAYFGFKDGFLDEFSRNIVNSGLHTPYPSSPPKNSHLHDLENCLFWKSVAACAVDWLRHGTTAKQHINDITFVFVGLFAIKLCLCVTAKNTVAKLNKLQQSHTHTLYSPENGRQI